MTRTRTRTLRWLIALAVLPVGLWSGYWVAGAFALEQVTARASHEVRRVGFVAEFDEARVIGYPTRFEMNLADLTVSSESLIWQTQAVRVDAESHRPFDIALDLSEPHRVVGRFGDLGIETSEALVTVLFRPEWDLPLGEIALDATNVVVGTPDQWRIDMTRVTSAFRQDPDGETTYRVTAVVEDMAFHGLVADLPADYTTIPDLRLDGLLRFDRAWDRSAVHGTAPVLVELVLNSAVLEFGSSTILLQAQLIRDQSALLSGTATVTVQDWRSLFEHALELGYLDRQLENLFLPMLLELASQEAPETELTLPLRIQNGMIFFGAFALGVLPVVP